MGCGPKGRRFESCQAYPLHRLGQLPQPVFVSLVTTTASDTNCHRRLRLVMRPLLPAMRIPRKAGAPGYTQRDKEHRHWVMTGRRDPRWNARLAKGSV